MEHLNLDDIDFSRQLAAYLYRSEGDQLEVGTDGTLIRLKDLEEEDKAKIEIMVNNRFPVEEYPEELDPVDKALREFGETFESFERSRNFYELTLEK